MSVRTDVINLNVNINGDEAKNQLNKLRTDAAKLTAEMKNLKKGSEEWIAKNKELGLVNERIKSLRSEIGLTALSQKELANELRRLQMLKLNLTPQTEEFKALQKQIDAVQGRLRDVRTGEFGFKKFWSSISTEVKQFGMLAAGYLGFDFVIGQTKNIIQMQTKMADEYANIGKTTSLTADEIKKLDNELRTLETRTSNSRLRDLAAEAGKLGKDGVSDIKRFVEEADKIEVALGEDLGEEGLNKIAKLSGILKEGMLNIASGINEIGAASAASEGYQVDFAFRMSGTAQAARIAAGDLLGFASTLEVNGQTAEIAGTAMSTFLMDFIKNSEQFGKAAGYAKGELTSLITDKGVNRGFLEWLKKMKDMSKTEADFMRLMESIGIDGARGAGVFLVLANNLGMVAEQQNIANKAVAEGTSVIDEFNTKNQNFAAVVDKLGKEFNAFFTSDTVNAGVKNMVSWFTTLIHATRDLIDWVSKHKTAMTSWIVAGLIQIGVIQKLIAWIALQVTGTKAATMAQIAQTIAEKAQIVATTALAAVKALLTGNITKLRQEMKLLWTTMGVNPVAATLIVLGALLVAFDSLISKTDKLTATEQMQLDLSKKINDGTAEKVAKVNSLVDAIKNENTTQDKKKKLLEQLIALDPAMLKGLDEKNIKTAQGEQIIRNYIKALEDAIKAEVMFSMQVDAGKRIKDLELEIKSYDRLLDDYDKGSKGFGKAMWDGTKAMFGLGPLAELDELKEKLKEATEYKKELDKEMRSLPNVSNSTVEEKTLAGGDLGIKKPKESDKDAKNKLRELEQLKSEMDKLAAEILKKKAAAENDLNALHALELKNLVEQYSERISKAKKLGADVIEELTDLKNEDIELLLNKQNIELQEKNYADSLKALNSYIENRESVILQDYADGLISTNDYNKQLNGLTAEGLEGRVLLAKNYKNVVKAASIDLEIAQTEIVKNGIKEREKNIENSYKSRLALADYKVASSPVDSKQHLDALKDRLKLEHEIKLEQEEYTQEEIMLMQEEYQQNLAALDKQYWQTKADMIIGIFQKIGEGISKVLEIANNKDQKQLDQERARNEIRAKNYKLQLDRKKISQTEYDGHINKLNAELEKKEIEFARKKAKRDKASAIFSAIINVAQGVTAALSLMPPLSFVMAAITGALGAVQIGAISSQPLPQARKGLIVNGPSHETGGIDLINNQTGETIAEMEGGEPVMILSKNTYKNNKEIVDQLIKSSQQQNGAAIKTNWFMKAQRPIVKEAATVMRDNNYSQVKATAEREESKLVIDSNNALLAQMIEEQRMTRQAIGRLKNIKAYVKYQDFVESDDLVNKAKELSGIK